MPDILNRSPATPFSALHATHVLHLPKDRIYIHRYALSAAPVASIKDVVEDKLEKFWRDIADRAENGKGMLEAPVAAIVGQIERELWCFTCKDDGIWPPDGVNEIQPPLPPLVPLDLLSCPDHSSSYKCLSESSCDVTLNLEGETGKAWGLLANALIETLAWKAGSRIILRDSGVVPFTPPFKPSLYPFTSSSLLLSLLPSPSPILSSPLYPTATHTLLPLSLPSILVSTALTPTPAQIARLNQTFDTLLGPAWKTGREQRVAREFVFGSGVEAEIISEMQEKREEEGWGVFWVPLLKKGSESEEKGVLTVWPIHLALPRLSDASTPNFSLGHNSSSTTAPLLSTQLKQFGGTEEREQGLMQIAHSLFDFFTSYREPSVPPEGGGGQVDDQDPDHDNEAGLVDNDAEMNETDGEGSNLRETGAGARGDIKMEPSPKEGSDIDDLFSSPSPTSTPIVNMSSQPQSNKSPQPQQVQDQSNNVQNGEEDFMSSLVSVQDPSPPSRSQMMGIRDREREREVEVEITEDDFAFFDSPVPEVGDGIRMDVDTSMDGGISQSLSDGAVDHRGETGEEPLIEQGKGILTEEMMESASPKSAMAGQGDLMLVPLVRNDMEVDGILPEPLLSPPVKTATKESPSSPLPVPFQPPTPPTILEASPKAPEQLVFQSRNLTSPSIPLVPAVASNNSLVPLSFQPLPLLPSSHSSSSYPYGNTYGYAPPSPASTPESSILARLASYQTQYQTRPGFEAPSASQDQEATGRLSSKRKSTYADAWFPLSGGDDDGDGEDGDENDMDSQAYTCPPTPISQMEEMAVEVESDAGSGGAGEVTGIDVDSRATGLTGMKDQERESKEDDEEIEWKGMKCIGSEWVVLRDQPGFVQAKKDTENEIGWKVESVWDEAWGTLPSAVSGKKDSVKTKEKLKEKKVKDVNWTKVVQEIITNRALRKSVLDSEDEHEQNSAWMGTLLEGDPLCEVFGSDILPVNLPQPQVNAASPSTPHIIRLSIAALSYWSQLGLEPQGGKKDVKIFIVCRDSDEALGKMLGEGVKLGWEEERFGKAEFSGIVKGKMEDFGELATGITDQSSGSVNTIVNTIVCLLTPPSQIPLNIYSSPVPNSPNTLFIPVPTPTNPSISFVHEQYLTLGHTAYDRLPTLLRPVYVRGEPLRVPQEDEWMQCPAWVLARKEAVKPEFVMTWPVDEYDVLNRWRMWHICYDVVSSTSPGPDAVIVWVGDDRGETGHVRVFEDVGGWKEGMEKICAYGREIAGRWNLEWRLSVCRAGIMAKEELQAWKDILKGKTWPITLLTSETPSPLNPSDQMTPPKVRAIANIGPSILSDSSTRIIDIALSAQLTILPLPLPLELSSDKGSPQTVYPRRTFLLTTHALNVSQHYTTKYHILSHQAPDGRKDQEDGGIAAEIAEEYHRLGCLARERWEGQGWLDAVRWGKALLEKR
ncbi:hypothetical protein L804_03416 [Cryptococcus deuterogattii 2001/935-1]|nr:hypothetical protein L804_03416 [Cryptococcus deuterogattii 2001/935-1]